MKLYWVDVRLNVLQLGLKLLGVGRGQAREPLDSEGPHMGTLAHRAWDCLQYRCWNLGHTFCSDILRYMYQPNTEAVLRYVA